MLKYTAIALILFAGIVIGFVAGESQTVDYAAQSPKRPQNVPSSAHWAGGPTGGNWFECAKEADAKFRCSVFADVTGALIVSGLYTVAPEDSGGNLRSVLLQSEYEIELKDARLVRVTKGK